jgi:hypothetical protein
MWVMLEYKGGRPRKYPKLEDMQKKINEYFNYCDSKKEVIATDNSTKVIAKPYTVTGLCLFLDITRDTLLEYEKLEGFSDTIKKAKNKIENYVEENSLVGKLNPTVSIFNLKNNFGWKDRTEVESHNRNENLNQDITNLSPEERRKRIEELKAKDK